MTLPAAGTRALLGGEMETQGPWAVGAPDRLEALAGVRAGGTWTASGRAALALLLGRLRRDGVERVHLPSFLCESLLGPPRALGLECSFYPVDRDLCAAPDPPPGAAVVVIHYFGWRTPAAASPGEGLLLEDLTHAALSPWASQPRAAGALSFFSARKLGPAPLGGWCSVQADPGEGSAQAEALMWRSLAARLIKADYLGDPAGPVDPDLERFYLEAFAAVEAFLDREGGAMPAPPGLLEVLAGIDWAASAARRRANWLSLHEALAGRVEPVMHGLPDDVVPLGYPIRLPARRRDQVRRALAARRVFCPVHWPLPAEVDPARFPEAHQLSVTLLTLPADQRYGPREMEALADLVAREAAGR